MKLLLIILLFYSTGFAQIDKKKIFFEDSVLPIMGGYQFDGVNDCVTLSSNPLSGFGSVASFSFYVKAPSNLTETRWFFSFGGTADGTAGAYCRLHSNKIQVVVGNGTTRDITAFSTHYLTANTNAFIVVTVELGVAKKLYVNGELKQEISLAALTGNLSSTATSTISVDGSQGYNSNFYGLRVFNRLLSSGEVTTLYNNGRPDLYDATSMSGLVANYVGSNAGQIGWIETQNNLHGQTSGSPNTLLLTEEVQRPQTYRDIKTNIAASTNTAMLGIIPKGYRLVRIQATGTGSLTAIEIGTSSGGNQVVESVGTTGTETKDLSITSTGLALYSATSNLNLYARHTAAGQAMTLLFTFERVQ